MHAGKTKLSAGTSFRAKPIFKSFLDELDSDKQHLLVIGVTYEYSRGADHGVTSREHKIMVDGTARWEFPYKLLLSNRNRAEFRWVDGDSRFGYRNRMLMEKAIKIGRRNIAPYVAAEGMWDQHYARWNQFRYTAGLQVPFIKRTSFDAYYERVRCLTCSDLHTNVFGLTFNIYMRLKKK